MFLRASVCRSILRYALFTLKKKKKRKKRSAFETHELIPVLQFMLRKTFLQKKNRIVFAILLLLLFIHSILLHTVRIEKLLNATFV